MGSVVEDVSDSIGDSEPPSAEEVACAFIKAALESSREEGIDPSGKVASEGVEGLSR